MSNIKENAKKGKKGFFRIVFSRTAIVFIMLAVQIAVLFGFVVKLNEYVTFFYGFVTVLSAIMVFYIINNRENPSIKLAWVIPILIFPVFGGLLYLFVRLEVGTKWINSRLQKLMAETGIYLGQDSKILQELEEEDPNVANLTKYLKTYGGFPVYKNTKAKYFPSGEEKFQELIKQLEEAKHFIFLEYFIVEEGIMWNTVLEILERKVKEGIEVRVMYDGMCCLVLLPYHYPQKLQKLGIQCKMFAPIKPALSTYQNNRDHRKIVVIDGHTAFTGGINLADEYINKKMRFGHWKDTAVMMQGDAVRSFTLMFLQMWNVSERIKDNYERYLVNYEPPLPILPSDIRSKEVEELEMGYIAPYSDSPVDDENVGENVYIDMLYTAEKYVHIMTPYLIPDNETVQALIYAAKRRVEVIIIMPHIPDKKYAFAVAKTYYQQLIEAGVQIYEYTPGFMHAKSFVSDGKEAVVGTINLDFRSLYLHFECAAYFYKNSVIHDVELDFQETLKKSYKVTLEDCKNEKVLMKLMGRFLRIFAPLM